MRKPDDHDPEPKSDLFEKTDEQGEPEFDFDLFEKTEYEPEEYDPEAELYDSSTDSLTVPEVSTGEMDAPAEIQKAFWGIVLVLNGAIFAVALGLMLIGFEGRTQDGGILLGGGMVLFAFVLQRYRAFKRKQERGEFDEDTDVRAETSESEHDDTETGEHDNDLEDHE